MVKKKQPQKQSKLFTNVKFGTVFPWLLIVTGAIGFGASFVLILEHIALLKDPSHQLSCSINPILSCGPVMQSSTATTFGFPNPILGLASFAAQMLLGVAILAGARLKTWFWRLWGAQVLASVVFMFYLMYESIFRIKAICIYCMAVWIVLSISAWYTYVFMQKDSHIKLPSNKMVLFVEKFHLEILVSWFVLLTGLILWEFWYFFGPKLGF